ncbi:MAG TPA: response regulator [Armatimonadota bacterium]|nr:response regulator [Armatimonadota bacterium]
MIGKRSILIADDEVNLCRILDAELRKAGYSVTTVHDGAQAVEQARCTDFQIIILDVRMPVLDGLSALREIRKFRKDIPVVVMTAYESHDTMASALAMGATACVNKPFDLESLVALVRATLDDGNGQKSVNWSGSVRTVLFNKNQPILLEVHDGERAGQYQSRIEDKDEQTLTVRCPSDNKVYVIPRAGTSVSIGFAGEDAFYSFETTVLANRESHTPTIVVGKPAVIYRVQRRKHPRMLVRMPADVALISKEGNGGEPGPVFRVHTENVGAGGLKIVSDDKLPEGTEVDVQVSDVPGLGWLLGRGKITRALKVATDDSHEWEYGIQFTKLGDEARQALRSMVESGELV